MSAVLDGIGLAATLLLVAVLVARELLTAAGDPRGLAVRRRLDLAAAPLLVVFLLVVAARFGQAM